MGGVGSGRHGYGGRPTVEGRRSLDIDRLNRAGALRAGYRGRCVWRDGDGRQSAAVDLRMEPGRLHLVLAYRVRSDDGRWEGVEQPTAVAWRPCRFGGARPYFLCPGVRDGVACGRRAVKLYHAGRRFLCRRCHGLAYASQAEPPWARALRRANGLRARLGGGPGMDTPPPRPRGMHRATYGRLRDELLAAEDLAAEHLCRRLDRLEREFLGRTR